ERMAYMRMFAGARRVRDRLPSGRGGALPSARGGGALPSARGGGALPPGRDGARKITAIGVFERGPAVPRELVSAGQIGLLWGLRDVQVGDTLGVPPPGRRRHRLARPALETAVAPRRPPEARARPA